MARKAKFTILQILLILLIIIGVVPLTITVYKMIDTNRNLLQNNEYQLQLSLTENISSQIYQYIAFNKDKLSNFAFLMRTSGINEPEALNEYIKRIELEHAFTDFLQGTKLQWFSILVINKEGKGIKAGQNIEDPELNEIIQGASGPSLKGTEYWSRPLFSKVLKKPLLVIAMPIRDKEWKPMGALIITLDLTPLLELVKQNSPQTETGRKVFVVDDKGYLFLDSNEKSLLEHKSMKDNKVVNEFLQQPNSFMPKVTPYDTTNNGKAIEMLATYKRVPEYSWGVFVQIEKDLALAGIKQMVIEAIKWALFSALIAIIMGIVFARETSSPIRSLANFAMSIAKERNFEKKIQVRSTYEIEQLASTLNFMTDEISNYIISLKKAAEENRQLFLNSVKMLVAAIDAKDPYTKGHSERVMLYSSIIAKYMNLSKEQIDQIEIGALLHDVGKIGIDDRILQKPEALTQEEYEVMKSHPEKGAKIMSQIPQLKDMLAGMHYHHEHYDGSGYPLGLKGEQIPLIARIICLADTFDAVTTERPYQAAMTVEKAVERVLQLSNSRFDSKIVKAFVSAYQHNEFAGMLQSAAHGK